MLGVDDRSRVNVTAPLWPNDFNSKNYIDAELRAKAVAEAAEALRAKKAGDMENNVVSLQSTKLNLEKSLAELQVKVADMESKLKQSSSESERLRGELNTYMSHSKQFKESWINASSENDRYKTDLEEVKAKQQRTKTFYTNLALALDPEWDGKLVYIFNGQSKTVIDAGADGGHSAHGWSYGHENTNQHFALCCEVKDYPAQWTIRNTRYNTYLQFRNSGHDVLLECGGRITNSTEEAKCQQWYIEKNEAGLYFFKNVKYNTWIQLRDGNFGRDAIRLSADFNKQPNNWAQQWMFLRKH